MNTRIAGVPKLDFDRSPFLVLWELTRACGLKCRHCRAVAVKERDREELEVSEAARFLDDLSGMGRPLIVLTGGDPVQRPDLLDIVDLCRERGFATAMTPSGTPSVTEHVIEQLKSRGLTRLAISLDAPDRMTHDYFRGVEGSFDWSMSIISWARKHHLPFQINTAISTLNVDLFDEMATLVEHLGAETIIELLTDGPVITARIPRADGLSGGAELYVAANHIHLFDKDGNRIETPN